MDALSRMIGAVASGGLVLDLQVIRPHPQVEADGRRVCEVDGSVLFRKAEAAVAAVEARIAAGDLVEEAVDDHDVRKHYSSGRELVDDVAQSEKSLSEDVIPRVRAIRGPVVIRERCRLRRLRVR